MERKHPRQFYFSRSDLILWSISVALIVVSFVLFDRESPMTLIASLAGVTSLILNAKGNPAGQVLMIVFSLLYGIISYDFAYYGEMITYLGMTAPMALLALISWLRNPYQKGKSEVRTDRLRRYEPLLLALLSILVTLIFYFILKKMGNANLLPSTLSVTTSFVAAYLTFRRNPAFALAYAANDVILLVLWISASLHDRSYLSVVFCFLAFLANDLYGFVCWRRMEKRQQAQE